MTQNAKEPLFNSKELNKILPSYLLDEIDDQQKDHNNYNGNQTDLTLQKENKKVK